MTPCGATVCTGCAVCVTAWSEVVGLRLAPWQKRLVDRMFRPPVLVLDRLLERRPEFAHTTTYRGVAVRTALMESA